jgi:hypothetical protein
MFTFSTQEYAMSERIARQMLESTVRKPTFKTAAGAIALHENVVRADTTGGAMTLTLPPVALAQGNFYSIHLVTDNGDLTIAHAGDSYSWTNIVLGDALENVLLYSDGFSWFNCGGVVVP